LNGFFIVKRRGFIFSAEEMAGEDMTGVVGVKRAGFGSTFFVTSFDGRALMAFSSSTR
jgi:hypothetical protein